MKISGNIIDIEKERIFSGEITVEEGVIQAITEKPSLSGNYILPGFIDAHVHVESSMVIPSEFARMAVVHGTVATVSDPHEIANVLGLEGVRYMIANGKQVPFKFYFGAPSCVPATTFETAGAVLDTGDIETLMKDSDVKYLAEMMNWPGVLSGDKDVRAKIAIAQKYGKVVDGHAPGLRGEKARQYAAAGITTDHECFTAEEAMDKLDAGMKVIIREGSAAKNFDALIGLMNTRADQLMFCSDDKHPDSLEEGHINLLVKRALAAKISLFSVLRAACINPIDHYGLDVGRLRKGDPADLIVVNNLQDLKVIQTFIGGQLVAENGRTKIPRVKDKIVNRFDAKVRNIPDFRLKAASQNIRVIEAMDGQLITNELIVRAKVIDGFAVSDPDQDILKIAVVNRYTDEKPALAFVKNFGLKKGAIASSVAHDSHNIIAVGVDDASVCRAVNLIIGAKGGVCAAGDGEEMIIPLPVGGIMSDEDGYEVAHRYKQLDHKAKEMGSTLTAPFMTLSFMALLVIPSLKISDRGLFNGENFQFVDNFC